MKTNKRLLSLALATLMLMSALSPAFSAWASDIQYISIADFSPLASSTTNFSALGVASPTTESKSYTSSSKTYYSEGKQLYSVIRKNTMARNTKFRLNLASAQKLSPFSIKSYILDLVIASTSDEFSSNAIDGDYIYWHLSALGLEEYPDYVYKNGMYLYDMTLVMQYRDNASQQKEVDAVVSSFLSKTKTSGMSDFEIIKAVHDFICSKATYDYDALKNINSSNMEKYNYAFTSYGALVKGKTVCQGYSLAFYRLCKELGYKCRFVSSDPDQGCHAWNIVELNGEYYFVDCTWDDESEDYNLFLVNYKNIRAKDSFSKEHLLDSNYYNTEYFNKNYKDKFSQENYDEEDPYLISNCKVSLGATSYNFTGTAKTPSVKVIATLPVEPEEPSENETQTEITEQNEKPQETEYADVKLDNTSYKVGYSGNTYSGEARVKVTGLNDFSGSSSRLFRIYPKAPTGLTVTARAYNSITLKWNKTSSKATGYYIYRDSGSGYKLIKKITSATTLTYTDKELSPSKKYSYRLKEYRQINNRTISSGSYASTTTCTTPKTPSITLSKKGKSITTKWNSVKCSGYELQYSTHSDMTKSKKISLSSKATSKTISKLKKGKYYVRLRAKYVYTYSNGTKSTYYSKWSTKKAITIK